jgi:TPP-dependent pyruvate/acetoin dehydrogenase alpha subunit
MVTSVNVACRTLAHQERVKADAAEIPRNGRLAGPAIPDPAGHVERVNARQMATETAQSSAVPADVSEHLTLEDRVGLLRAMLMMRGIEQRAMTLYRQGKVPGSFYDGFGQEAVSAGAAWAMAADDRLCILHRDLAAHVIRGVTPARIFAQYMGRATGITGGRDGNVHFGDRRLGCVGMVSMLPDMMLVATGIAMAFKMRGERRAALTWFGDGSTSRGDFHEAMNWAGVQKLPVIFILENNQYAYSTPLDQQFAVDPLERAAGYGFPGVKVDGNDPEAMFEATRVARERAIADEGPTMLEAVTMRMHGHAAHDDMKYVPKEQVEEWRKKDPIDRQVRRLEALGVDVEAVRAEVKAEIERGVEEALAAPMPEADTATDRVFADEPALLEDGNAPWSGFAAKGS